MSIVAIGEKERKKCGKTLIKEEKRDYNTGK
jgi:hypothetical protein